MKQMFLLLIFFIEIELLLIVYSLLFFEYSSSFPSVIPLQSTLILLCHHLGYFTASFWLNDHTI